MGEKKAECRWLAVGVVLVMIGSVAGCDRTPPPPTDPAKAPWLLDPQSQIEGLKNSDVRIRGISAFNLGNMGAKAAEAIPLLEKLAQDDANAKVRENARLAIEKIRTAAGSSTE
jgi:hypothetical protein